MNRVVKSAKLHTTFFWDGMNMPAQLPPQSATVKGLKMRTVAEGILISSSGRSDIIIPWGTVQVATLGEEIDDTVKAVAPKASVKKAD